MRRPKRSCRCWVPRSVMVCCLMMLVCMSISVMSFLYIIRLPEYAREETGLSFNPPGSKFQKKFKLSPFEFAKMDYEWTQALRHNEIEDAIVIGHHGLAEKYVFILEGGYLAMAKPVERELVIFPRSSLGKYNWFNLNAIKATRMDRAYQGWSEIAGTALDRILKFNRKPTIVGRYIESSVLYRHDYSAWGRILYALPNRQIPVSMHAWVRDLGAKVPSEKIGRLATKVDVLDRSSSDKIPFILETSDVLIFDFIVDDHDRRGNHNWKTSSDDLLLAWDSGLAWNYGPVSSDPTSLCGLNTWLKKPVDTPHWIQRESDCKKICMFRRSTIDTLRAFGPSAEPSKRLGEQLIESLRGDIIAPVFDFGLFTVYRSGWLWFLPVTARFDEQSFADGINERVALLLDHVQECISTYGEMEVLFDEQKM